MTRSNCIIFAIALYLRRRAKGRDGYILLRRSRLGSLVPHMLYAERRQNGLRIVHFVPTDTRSKRVPPPLFEGLTRWGD